MRAAISALYEGKPILLLDAHDRENEGDLIIAAEKITAQSMNFLIREGSGVVCLAMPKADLEALGLPMMIHNNTNTFQTAFTVSIEAATGVSTGVSAKDRAHTIQTAIADDARPEHLARPGHVFPLAARMGGVFERMGHTEGSVDLMKIAGLKAGAVLCELMNPDGSMTVGQERINFAHNNNIPVLCVEDIFFYRIKTEDIFSRSTTKNIETRFGPLTWRSFQAFDSTIDLFMPRDFAPSSACNLNIIDGNNLHNRFLSQLLTQSNDDALALALANLSRGVVAMIDGECDKRSYAILCRSLMETGVSTLARSNSYQDFYTIAEEHFSFQIVRS